MLVGFVYATTSIVGNLELARANDLAAALTFAQGIMGDDIVEGYEDFVDYDPDEALALLLSPIVEPDRPLSSYAGDGDVRQVDPHFVTLGGERLNFDVLRPFIAEAAEQSRLPVALIDAVIRTESGYRPAAVSRSGAKGLMQLMPATARSMGVSDPLDPRQNILGGAAYLRAQYDRFRSLPLALAAYNAGPARVVKSGGIPEIPETKRYVATVLKRFETSSVR